MFNVGEYVIYRGNVCKIIDIKTDPISNSDNYALMPIEDKSLIINVPITNTHGFLRGLITKEQIEKIIEAIPEVLIIEGEERKIDNKYKELLNSDNHIDLIRIIKTTYLRNDIRKSLGKKISEKDNNYFQMAENKLYNEFSIVLNLDYENTKNYVVSKVEEIINKTNS